jgi:ubiquitin C-terminal hydrolase
VNDSGTVLLVVLGGDPGGGEGRQGGQGGGTFPDSVLAVSVDSDLSPVVSPFDNNDNDLLKAIEESKLAVIPLTQMRRGDSEPVGINNVGNTCFLSSLLQTYYSIPSFVKCIFNFFEKSLRVGSDPASIKIQSGQQVIWELQRIFAFLTLYRKNQIEPRELLRVLVDDNGVSLQKGIERDIREFNDILISRVQDAMEAGLNRVSGMTPMPGQ